MFYISASAWLFVVILTERYSVSTLSKFFSICDKQINDGFRLIFTTTTIIILFFMKSLSVVNFLAAHLAVASEMAVPHSTF